MKKKGGRGSYRSFASPFIRWSSLSMGREEEGRNGRVEPTGVRIDRRVSFASRDAFYKYCYCVPRKTFAACKTLPFACRRYKYFSYLY